MITIRKSNDRGYADRGWLRSHATFSFGGYHDPNFVGFRALRVLNEDRIAPGKGFGPHSHRDMEILTYMVEGKLAHRDSLSGPHVLGRNELQAMTAGDGIVHSEFNASDTEPSHSIQIWIDPVAEDLAPAYQQVAFTPEEKRGRLHLLAGPESSDSSRTAVIRQQARVYVTEVRLRRSRDAHACAGTARLGAGGSRPRRGQRASVERRRRCGHQRRAARWPSRASGRTAARSCCSIWRRRLASAQTAVVVAFSSRCGATEALALAAAVGAVQGRALIRLAPVTRRWRAAARGGFGRVSGGAGPDAQGVRPADGGRHHGKRCAHPGAARRVHDRLDGMGRVREPPDQTGFRGEAGRHRRAPLSTPAATTPGDRSRP